MRERVALLGGSAADRIDPGFGTTLVAEVPVAMTIRVLIVDDHAVVRAGLQPLLDAEDDIETVGEAGDAREAVFEARAPKPDVVLMDVVLPAESGIDVTPESSKSAGRQGARALDAGRSPLRAGGLRGGRDAAMC